MTSEFPALTETSEATPANEARCQGAALPQSDRGGCAFTHSERSTTVSTANRRLGRGLGEGKGLSRASSGGGRLGGGRRASAGVRGGAVLLPWGSCLPVSKPEDWCYGPLAGDQTGRNAPGFLIRGGVQVHRAIWGRGRGGSSQKMSVERERGAGERGSLCAQPPAAGARRRRLWAEIESIRFSDNTWHLTDLAETQPGTLRLPLSFRLN